MKITKLVADYYFAIENQIIYYKYNYKLIKDLLGKNTCNSDREFLVLQCCFGVLMRIDYVGKLHLKYFSMCLYVFLILVT